MIGKLIKLKGRSFAEIKERGRQKASIITERLGLSMATRIPSDEKFFDLFDLKAEKVSGEALLDHVRRREKPLFYSSFDDPTVTIDVLRQHFPKEVPAIIKSADRICEGYFDLLGYENLYFGSGVPNWHFDPVSKKTSPMVHWSQIDETSSDQTGDKKITWELNRHQYFLILGRAYWLTKDEKYADVFISHVEDWMANNPPKIGLNWLSSLEISFRSISWIWAFHFFKNSPKLTSPIFTQMLKVLHLNGRHIESYLSTYSSPNTHLTGEALGLYFLGTCFPEIREAKRWKECGYEILLDALDFQVRADGVYCEQTSQYHRYTTDFYLNLLILRQIEGLDVDQKLSAKLKQLLEFLMFIAQPNGETPLFGDEDGGRLHFLDESVFANFRPTLAVGSVVFDDPNLKFAARDASAELLWLVGPEGLNRFDEIKPVEPEERVKAFKAGGFFSVRDSWGDDSNFLLIDCGEHGFLKGGHAHADALHFHLSVYGQPVFIDSGTYNYTSDTKARELYRSTAAHNCLTVNGESSSVPEGPFSWTTSTASSLNEWSGRDEIVTFKGTHDGFERFGVRYEREIKIDNEVITISDAIRSGNSNSYELNFILSPRLEAEIADDLNVIVRAKEEKRSLLTIDTKLVSGDGMWRIEPFSISPRYGMLAYSTKLVFETKAEGDFVICNTLKCVNN